MDWSPYPQCRSRRIRRASAGYPSAFPSIFNALIFSELQINFFANSLFSDRSKAPGGGQGLPACPPDSHGLPITSHVFSRSCRLLPFSLQRFHPSFPLFSAAYRHFSADPGVGVVGNFRPIESVTYKLFSLNFSRARRYVGPKENLKGQ